MTVRPGRVILFIFMIMAAVGLWRILAAEQEREKVAQAYQETQLLMLELAGERDHLNAELAQVTETVEGQSSDLTNLQGTLRSVQQSLNTALDEIVALKRNHAKLSQENQSLIKQLGAVLSEKETLSRRLSSLRELKLAIKDVKQRIRNDRSTALQARIQSQQADDQKELALGNRGFVVRGGKSTVGASSKIQVLVLDPQPQ